MHHTQLIAELLECHGNARTPCVGLIRKLTVGRHVLGFHRLSTVLNTMVSTKDTDFVSRESILNGPIQNEELAVL